MNESTEMNCAQLRDVAAELALGVLTGRERADALAHLERCEDCREHVRQLMATSEGLLGLLPASEPPAGFETRVLDRLGLAPAGPASPRAHAPQSRLARLRRRGRDNRRESASRGPRSRRLIAAAAIAVAVVGAGASGWQIGASTARPVAAPVAAAPVPLSAATFLTATRTKVGQLFVYQAKPRWIYMSVDLPDNASLPAADGMVTCQVIGADGKATSVGTFRLDGGYGAWGSPDPWSDGTVRGARLLAADGTVLATATVPVK
ncbi:MAG TPA: hypothetical protein VH478_15720 [Trebonia sp.]|jgi:hypothetical protein|nr:hypothetical protein [Trebonia sp.]